MTRLIDKQPWFLVLGWALAVAVGCGPGGLGNGGSGGHGGHGGAGGGGSGGSAPPGSSLEILPANANVVVASGARATVDYVALIHTPGQTGVMDAKSLPRVETPNRKGLFPDPRPYLHNPPCRVDCR